MSSITDLRQAVAAQSPQAQGRIEYLDIAKGIGIILVVIGHLPLLDRPVHDFIYLFHMPLFFILSGYFYNHKKRTSWTEYIGQKARRLIIPFLFFWIVPALLLTVKMRNLEWDVWLGWVTSESFFDSPIWFLPVLFAVCLIYKAAYRHRLVITSTLGIASYYIGTHTSIPCFIDTICLCLIYYFIGNAIRGNLTRIVESEWKLPSCIIILSLLVLQATVDQPEINYRNFSFTGIGLITLISCGVMGSYLTLTVSARLKGGLHASSSMQDATQCLSSAHTCHSCCCCVSCHTMA